MQAAETILLAFGAYGAVGLAFALWFVAWGAQRLDEAAHGMPVQARLILMPGAAALWPYLAWRQIRGEGPPVQ